jgi:hypothetical protein
MRIRAVVSQGVGRKGFTESSQPVDPRVDPKSDGVENTDPQLKELAQLWSNLPRQARKAILELAKAYGAVGE